MAAFAGRWRLMAVTTGTLLRGSGQLASRRRGSAEPASAAGRSDSCAVSLGCRSCRWRSEMRETAVSFSCWQHPSSGEGWRRQCEGCWGAFRVLAKPCSCWRCSPSARRKLTPCGRETAMQGRGSFDSSVRSRPRCRQHCGGAGGARRQRQSRRLERQASSGLLADSGSRIAAARTWRVRRGSQPRCPAREKTVAPAAAWLSSWGQARRRQVVRSGGRKGSHA